MSLGGHHVVDSSGWLEILVGGANAREFERVIETGRIIVPAISIFEVSKRALLLSSEKAAQRVEQHMRRFTVVDLTAERASAAARLSIQHKLPMADSLIYAAALEFQATLWTQDDDFARIKGVRYFSKQD
jgi:toxin FitB